MRLAQGQQLDPVKPEGQKASVYAVALDEEGRLLASGSPSAMLRINDCRSGAKIMKLRGHTDNIRCARSPPPASAHTHSPGHRPSLTWVDP